MATYSVKIKLDDETLNALNNGFQLQAFKGVKAASPAGGLPTVWLTVNKFSSDVVISWQENFGGYFSKTNVQEGNTVDISTSNPMNPGDVITLSKSGSSSVTTIGGVPGAYCFESQQEITWASGLLSAATGQSPTPICAFPQYGAVGNIMAPYEKILILFTQGQVDTGAVLETAVSKSVSVILSTLTPSATLGFSINKGWDTQGNPQAKQNPQNFSLAPDLIVPSVSLQNMARLKQHERAIA